MSQHHRVGCAFLIGAMLAPAAQAEPLRLDRDRYEAGAVVLHDGGAIAEVWDAPGRNWTGADGSIVRTGHGGDTWYRRHRLAGEFDLSFEYSADAGATGGVGVLRSQRVLAIGGPAVGSDAGCPPAPAQPGRWHRGRIRAAAGRVEITIDGKLLCSVAAGDAVAGDAGLFFPRLLDGAGVIRFRRLVAEPVPLAGQFVPSPLAGLRQKIAIADGFGRYAAGLPADFVYRDGEPLPGLAPAAPLKLEMLGEDATARYYRYSTPALQHFEATGLILVPKRVTGPMPVMIAIHGTGGSPELALQPHHVYHDMLRGPVRDGWLVIAPQLATFNRREAPYGNNIDPAAIAASEDRLLARRLPILAVEGARVSAALTGVMAEFAVDRERIAATGLSYGGFLTTWLAAYDSRVKAGVSVAGFSPFVGDEVIPVPLATLRSIAPKPFAIIAGEFDPFHDLNAGWAQDSLPMVEAAYGAAQKGGRFAFIADTAGHDYSWARAAEFLRQAWPEPSAPGAR